MHSPRLLGVLVTLASLGGLPPPAVLAVPSEQHRGDWDRGHWDRGDHDGGDREYGRREARRHDSPNR